MPTTNTPLITFAEQADHQGEGAGDGFDEVERDHQDGGLGEGGGVATEAAGSNAEPGDGDEDDQGEGGVGLEVGGGGFDAGDQGGPVGGEDEQEQRADQRQKGRRVGAHGVADLRFECLDDDFQGRLAVSGGASEGRRRVSSQLPPASSSMMPQVATTGVVTATGPI